MTATSPWQGGRFGSRGGQRLLFGQMYEDPEIELSAFAPGGRVFCIASAGCTARRLAAQHEVVAVDINPVQLAYAQRRLTGGPALRGSAEALLAFGRRFAPLLGWRAATVRDFCDLDQPAAQVEFWHRYLDTRRFRATFDAVLSASALAAVYSRPLRDCLPPRFGAVLRARMLRTFARAPNRRNPYLRALLLGALPEPSAAPMDRLSLVCADAAAFLEAQPARGFDGFSLSNILDGAGAAFEGRLLAAVRHAAAPGAVAVLRSFAEPGRRLANNRAAEDRSMLWGVVEVRPAS